MAFLLMSFINAQTGNTVNAYSANEPSHSSRMGKKAESEPCAFWKRLTEAWGTRELPTSQNGVATRLNMSQGSTRRWFTGDGLPETETIMEIARLGKVTVDWLLSGHQPKTPIAPGSDLDRLLAIWGKLDADDRSHILRAAEGQLARQHQGHDGEPTTTKSPGRRSRAA